MRKLFHTAIILLLTALFTGISGTRTSHAFELTPYTRLGSIQWKEDSKDNKFFDALGLDVTTGGEQLKKSFSVEFWQMAEPVDENFEMIQAGRRVSAGISYFARDWPMVFYPTFNISFDIWERNENPQYKNRFCDLHYLSVNLGFGVKYDVFYAEFKFLLPFWSRADHPENLDQSPDGQIGFDVTVGTELLERVNLSLFYERTRFGADGEQPECRLDRRGLLIGIKF